MVVFLPESGTGLASMYFGKRFHGSVGCRVVGRVAVANTLFNAY